MYIWILFGKAPHIFLRSFYQTNQNLIFDLKSWFMALKIILMGITSFHFLIILYYLYLYLYILFLSYKFPHLFSVTRIYYTKWKRVFDLKGQLMVLCTKLRWISLIFISSYYFYILFIKLHTYGKVEIETIPWAGKLILQKSYRKR